MKARDYFPLGKAHGKAFCNREQETEWLVNNIKAGKHSLIMAPRRFGKSSLAEKATKMSELPITTLNFNTCTDEYDIASLIRQGISQLIGNALGSVDKITHSIKNYVTHLTPKISLGPKFANLELTVDQNVSPALSVEETLELIEKLLAEKKKSAVILFDEFQMVGLIAKGTGVEASIRNAAQDMKYLSIIFSGSSRNLLQAMFEDEARPLYKLCRKLHLRRINASHYHKHLNQAAKLAWKTNLDEAVFQHIMLLSERHPYYVNYLCDVLWTECTSAPKVNDVDAAWDIVIEEEQSDTNVEIANLSMGQKKIIRYIANYTAENLLSAIAVKETGMAVSSISGALTGLIEKDVIVKEDDTYHIINPVIKHYFSLMTRT